jgi:thymidine kinase
MKHKPSSEQLAIIEQIEHTNVKVDAVAGSGKTTTVLHMSNFYKKKKLLQLTYNSRLKTETREKVIEEKITNLEVHNYHAFCCKYYNKVAFKDIEIMNLITKDLKQTQPFKYDIIIVDECQDMTHTYFKLVLKIIKDNANENVKLCILGDERQSIYEFMLSDRRFLTLADKLFNIQPSLENWVTLKLSESFRVTYEMSQFINECVLNQKRIVATKIGVKPRYLICDTFNCSMNRTENAVLNEIYRYIEMGYKYEDIFILAPIIRTEGSPIRLFANMLSNKLKLPVYVPTSEDEKLDPDVLKNKICFSSQHSTKGLERKVVIVYCFDNYYFNGKQDKPKDICPNEIYVAITRAQEQLTVLHNCRQEYLPFLDVSKIETYCEVIKHKNINTTQYQRTPHHRNMPPTTLIKHIPVSIKQRVLSYITYTECTPSSKIIDIPLKSKQDALVEVVSDITGTAIPAYYEYLVTGKMTINKDLNKDLINLSTPLLLEIATTYNSKSSGYTFKLDQIVDYNWLSNSNLDKSIKRLSKHISDKAIFETEMNSIILNCIITGRIDCIDNDTMWELKCVSKLDEDHYIQVAIYMYLINEYKDLIIATMKELPKSEELRDLKKKFKLFRTLRKLDKIKKYYVYNILDDNLIRIESTPEKLTEMMNCLVEFKTTPKKVVLEPEFLEEIEIIKTPYITKIQKIHKIQEIQEVKEVIKIKQKPVKCIFV